MKENQCSNSVLSDAKASVLSLVETKLLIFLLFK